jgi:hypothetical protein
MKTRKRPVKTVSLLSVVCGSLWLPVLISLLWLVLNTPFLKTEATCDDVNPTMMTTTATTTGTYKREVEVVDSILHSIIWITSFLIVRFYLLFFYKSTSRPIEFVTRRISWLQRQPSGEVAGSQPLRHAPRASLHRRTIFRISFRPNEWI